MHVAQLLDPLLIAPDIEVVVTLLPEMKIVRTALQRTRDLLLHHLQYERQRFALWFADEQMDMLWHEDITTNVEVEAETSGFERTQECRACSVSVKSWLALITAEGDEVQVSRVLVTLEKPRHQRRD